jgi:hypothetical protein
MASHALRRAVRTRASPMTARSTVSIMPTAIERTERGISTRPLGWVLMVRSGFRMTGRRKGFS